MWRGNCTFASKVLFAMRSGAAALIIANNLRDSGPVGMAISSLSANVTVFSCSYELGAALALAAPAGAVVSLSAHGVQGRTVTTQSMCADSPFGSASSVVVTGAHLDSVDAGEGVYICVCI